MLSRNFSQPINVPPNLARTLLAEFGKTRTSYSTLVPNIIEVMRIYKDFPEHCPIPIVTKLDDLLTEDELSRIERQYPQSIENGFLVLCTERRALKSGGGGKYYFIDSSDRLVGCPKGHLARHAQKGVLSNGPVLLKNLIFVFILRGPDGLGCKSSNPKRLLEFYEAMTQQGSAADIRYLLRVWSMEVHVDYGNFPPCSLLWIKQMDLKNHVQKWRDSQYQNNQRQIVKAEVSALNEVAFQTAMRRYHEGHLSDNFCHTNLPRPPRRGNHETHQQLGTSLEKVAGTIQSQAVAITTLNEWIGAYQFPFSACETLYQNFSEIVPFLQPTHIIEWSNLILEKLNDSILAAAMELIATTFGVEAPNDCRDREANRFTILTFVCNLKEKERIAEGLRILLACLVQQNRIEQLALDSNPGSLLSSATTTPSKTATSSVNDQSDNSDLHGSSFSISEAIFPATVDQLYYQNENSVSAAVTNQSTPMIPLPEQQQYHEIFNSLCEQPDVYWNQPAPTIDQSSAVSLIYSPPITVMMQTYCDIEHQSAEMNKNNLDNVKMEDAEEDRYDEIDVLRSQATDQESAATINAPVKLSEGSTEASSTNNCTMYPFQTIQ